MWIIILIVAVYAGYVLIKNSKESKEKLNTRKYNVAVKGLLYREHSAQIRAGKIKENELLILKKESDNTHDKYAVAVYTNDDYHIGYIDSFFSFEVSKIIDEDRIIKCVVSRTSAHTIPYIYADIIFKN